MKKDATTVSIGCRISAKPVVTIAVNDKVVAEIPPQKFLDNTGLGHFFFQLKPDFVKFMRGDQTRNKPPKDRKVKNKCVTSISCCGVGVLDHPDCDVSAAELKAIGKAFIAAAAFREIEAYGRVFCADPDGDGTLVEINLDHSNVPYDEVNGLPVLKEIKIEA